MNAKQVEKSPEQIAKNAAMGKAFFVTGIALLVINGLVALVVGKPQVLVIMLPVSIVFAAVGGGLWLQGRKGRQQG